MPGTTKLRRPWHGEKLGLAWAIVMGILYVPFSVLVKSTYRNLDKLPQTGGAIIVVNHVSHADPFLVAKMVIDGARRPRFLAKDTLFTTPIVGLAMRTMGHIPVKRGTADARESLGAAVDALRAGGMIVLHPEGTVTRDPDGWPMIGKTGAARLALLAPEIPVIPIAQWGVQDQINLYRKKIKLIPRPKHVMSVGAPIDLSEFAGADLDEKTLHVVTDVIMRRLRNDVAALRGLPAPTGDLFHWVRPTDLPSDELRSPAEDPRREQG
ncbi:lysophospholipid acyltransferase family protein [Jatrophihabitans sp.]|uniref:lysophospholipid acyltransferase family protein n=1 Tax=Jatrophihabitans sp. TaxID=1932789 RepID=UPI0030C7020B|nr:acyltransferase [Jatrophihabitans sp.]